MQREKIIEKVKGENGVRKYRQKVDEKNGKKSEFERKEKLCRKIGERKQSGKVKQESIVES